MTPEKEILIALFALRLGFVSREGLVAVVKSWARDPARGVTDRLTDLAYLRPAQLEALADLAEAAIAAHGGDASRALAAAPVDCLAQEAILAAGLPDAVASVVARIQALDPGMSVIVAPDWGDRYEVGKEIGRGGIGRILEATDRALGREVALKTIPRDLPPAAAERFLREAKLTARLDHPQVVPVYDFGEMPDKSGRKRLFISMRRIRGRDLALLLQLIRDGDAEAGRKFTRLRLLVTFQDICLGVAYAHSKGVIHRDLKPSNVMIGDYGETYIVDWGLAKERGTGERAGGWGLAPEPAPPGEEPGMRSAPTLTLMGDVLGTPAYMSPEQAAGRNDEVDERSDIYALGAILYHILTFGPPWRGETESEVLRKARAGELEPPSRAAGKGESVPPELDAICARAMAPRREERYATALELHQEVQAFLEGTRERERARREARERAEEGVALLARVKELTEEIAAQELRVRALDEAIGGHEPVEAKRPLWDAEARLAALREERISAFSQADAVFSQALAVDRRCAEALEGKCGLFVDRYLDAERHRNREEMLLWRKMLEPVDRDGRARGRLDAPGRLSVRAFARACGCLKPVREPGWRVGIEPETSVAWRDGHPRPGEPLNSSDRAVPRVRTFPERARFGHLPDCARSEPPDVEVFISRYLERDKRLVPDAERFLGMAPLETEIPQGSWLLTLRPPAPWRPVRLPVLIRRDDRAAQDISLYTDEEVPPDFCQVPAGPGLQGGNPVGGGRMYPRITGEFFVGRFAVTCAEYLAFLNGLVAEGRNDEARARVPRDTERPYWSAAEGGFRIPAPGEDPRWEWDPQWPVFGVDWYDACAFCDWRSARDGRVYTLLHEEEYEKAARGVDGRVFPWGNHYDGTFAHTNASLDNRVSPLPVGSFPVDESPYGVRDLAGGVYTWCLNSPERPQQHWRTLRGTSWSNAWTSAWPAHRRGNPPRNPFWSNGLRLAFHPWAWPQNP
ncbi:MAG: SUMF1/EgtB/PvdO family nonheme iron enzyme [Planctomycetes bacterium]|nr:SUMF1/EgtB/PvdO family nonheme iron enzyme [Planctomycetota bacterium]